MARRLAALVPALALLGACSQGAPDDSASLSLAVAPLNYPGLTNATYAVEVRNDANQIVFSRTLDSIGYGAGDGSVSYVGTCDTSANPNVVTLTLTHLYSGTSGANELPVTSYQNPGPLSRAITCVANADVAVAFDLAIIRQANQGFFDIAVAFSDVYCSAKKLCGSPRSGDSLRAFHQPRGQHDERGDPEQA